MRSRAPRAGGAVRAGGRRSRVEDRGEACSLGGLVKGRGRGEVRTAVADEQELNQVVVVASGPRRRRRHAPPPRARWRRSPGSPSLSLRPRKRRWKRGDGGEQATANSEKGGGGGVQLYATSERGGRGRETEQNGGF